MHTKDEKGKKRVKVNEEKKRRAGAAWLSRSSRRV